MKELLKRRLRGYIKENNADLLVMLMEEKKEDAYINNAVEAIDHLLHGLMENNEPLYIIEETCFDQLTKPLRPSKYNYVKAIAGEKFPKQYYTLERAGILATELINILTICLPLFEVFSFSEENEDDEYLHYTITTAMKGYFNELPVLENRSPYDFA
jgi:hypothetical protein